MAPVRGKLITLEGLEGVGKTTNRQVVESLLESHAIDFVATREPGGTELGEQLRNLVLHEADQMHAETELLMMVAARFEHIAQVIEPGLSSGRWVLCDRFIDASIAYQGAGRELGMRRVQQLHELMGITIEPDLTLLLDMPVDDGLERMTARGEPDRIEREASTFFDRAREAYRQQASDNPHRVRIIDASRSLDDVKADVEAAVNTLLCKS
ncbi:MAG: dTMP kinase [Granulosicoccus sp.]